MLLLLLLLLKKRLFGFGPSFFFAILFICVRVSPKKKRAFIFSLLSFLPCALRRGKEKKRMVDKILDVLGTGILAEWHSDNKFPDSEKECRENFDFYIKTLDQIHESSRNNPKITVEKIVHHVTSITVIMVMMLEFYSFERNSIMFHIMLSNLLSPTKHGCSDCQVCKYVMLVGLWDPLHLEQSGMVPEAQSEWRITFYPALYVMFATTTYNSSVAASAAPLPLITPKRSDFVDISKISYLIQQLADLYLNSLGKWPFALADTSSFTRWNIEDKVSFKMTGMMKFYCNFISSYVNNTTASDSHAIRKVSDSSSSSASAASMMTKNMMQQSATKRMKVFMQYESYDDVGDKELVYPPCMPIGGHFCDELRMTFSEMVQCRIPDDRAIEESTKVSQASDMKKLKSRVVSKLRNKGQSIHSRGFITCDYLCSLGLCPEYSKNPSRMLKDIEDCHKTAFSESSTTPSSKSFDHIKKTPGDWFEVRNKIIPATVAATTTMVHDEEQENRT